MRKLLIVLVLLAVAVVPAFAQDATPEATTEAIECPATGEGTLADLVVASTTAETPEFTTLLTAVQAADPAVLEALSNPDACLTVFAPTDAAFAAAFEALGEEAVAELLADPEALTSVLLFHVLDGAVLSADVVAALEENEGAFSVPTLNGQYIDVAGDVENGITIDGANLNLEMIDIQASNGVVHVIDAVILPETRTLAEIVTDAAGDTEAPEFTTLLTAVAAADPAVLEALSDPEAELTVFAPTDAAFTALSEALGAEALGAIVADPAQLTPILLYHVVEGRVYSLDLVGLLMEAEMMTLEVPTLQGGNLTITATDEGVFINETVQIIATDIDAANGVIHVIDGVLVPSE